MSSAPSVAILVLNYNGLHHLRECLPSLDALDDPNAHVVVVDNGSRDQSLSYVRRHHPRAQIIDLGRNRGFAGGYNEAIRRVNTDLVALLNNDTRVDRHWLTELRATMNRHDATAVASSMVDWDGSRIDFAGALPTFVGHSWQVGNGEPVGVDYPERQLLFGCGGSLLIRRDKFLSAGGFDEDYFAYFEDVDLGWRLTLFGERTFYAPKAVTFHRVHGTASGWSYALRLRLYERNALATIYKNYGDEALMRILPAAVALSIARGVHQGGFDSTQIAFGRSAPPSGSVPPPVIATLIALEDFARWLPALRDKRRAIQARRRVDDQTILALFPDPLRLHEVSDSYRASAETLIRDFRIAELFGLPAPSQAGRARVASSTPPVKSTPATTGKLVSIVVLTATGARHLPDCLDSLRQQTWPAPQIDLIVVDNGSADDPTAEVERHYPGARVIRTGANLGFAGGNNAGARVAHGDWLLFLNDDTRVAPDWLEELMQVAERRGAASVGALILDWDGSRVDFGGGLANMEARGYSLSVGMPVSDVKFTEEPILFGCGAGVLFRRDLFDATGGWDEDTFAYYEDVEIGWRLWLLGHEVWFAPKAIVYHKHHGTSGAGSAARRRALERNAFRILYTHLEERSLQRSLPAALLLAMDRALLATSVSRAQEATHLQPFGRFRQRLRPGLLKVRYLHALSQRGARRARGTVANLRTVGVSGLVAAAAQVGRDLLDGWESVDARGEYLMERMSSQRVPENRSEELPIDVTATLLGIQDFLTALPALSEKRACLQAARRRTDREIVQRFHKHWLSPVPSAHQDLHNALQRKLVDLFDVIRPS